MDSVGLIRLGIHVKKLGDVMKGLGNCMLATSSEYGMGDMDRLIRMGYCLNIESLE